MARTICLSVGACWGELAVAGSGRRIAAVIATGAAAVAPARFSAFGSAVPVAAASTGGIGSASLVPLVRLVGSTGFARRSQGTALR